MEAWIKSLWYQFDLFLVRVADFVPNLVGALVILLLAWVFGRILRYFSIRLLEALDRLLERLFPKGPLSRFRLPRWAMRLVGGLIFWITILLGLEVATRVLNVPLASQWLDGIVDYVPTLIAVVVITIAGVLASTIVREFATTSARSAGIPQAKQLGVTLQVAALGIAIIVGLDQLGIDVALLITLVSLVLGAALGGLALAFGLGARSYVANVLAARHVSKLYRSGSRIRIDQYEGIVDAVGPTFVTVGTADGVIAVPARLFFDRASVSVQDPNADGS